MTSRRHPWSDYSWSVTAVALLAFATAGALNAQEARVHPAKKEEKSLQSLAKRPKEIGVWITNSPSPIYYSPALLKKAISELKGAGFTTVYPNVWSRGTTFHRSRFAPVEPALQKAGLTIDPICSLTREAHARKMKVVPWFEYGLMEPADAEVVKQHPDWVLARADGSSTMKMHGHHKRVWLNPAHPEVRSRFIGLVIEVLKRCRMDGLQLDDHFAWPVELGYDPYTVALYTEQTGSAPPKDYTNRYWMKWRRRQLTGLLKDLRNALKKEQLSIRISLAPGPFRFAYNHWLQDWEIWAVGELIDDLVVQNYAYSLKGFEKDLNQTALLKAQQWGLPVNIGILAGFGKRTTPMSVLEKKVRLSAERGHGVIYFFWEGLWGEFSGPNSKEYRRDSFKRIHPK